MKFKIMLEIMIKNTIFDNTINIISTESYFLKKYNKWFLEFLRNVLLNKK